MFHACLIGENPEAISRLIASAEVAHYFDCPVPFYHLADFLHQGVSFPSFNLIFVDSDTLNVDEYLIARIRRYHRRSEIIALATARNTTLLIGLLKIGVDGFVLQNTKPQEFQLIISSFQDGGPFMSPRTLKDLIVAVPSVLLKKTEHRTNLLSSAAI